MYNILSLNTDIVTRLFYVIDDLCKAVQINLLPSGKTAGRRNNLTPSEIITIAILFSFLDTNAFKKFYTFYDLQKYFPNVPCYSRLLINVKEAMPLALLLLKILMHTNRKNSRNKIKIIDSMPLPVCKNKRIFNFKSSVLAERGMSSMGWFYGFKIHLVIDQDGNLLNIEITPGNTNDKNHELVKKLLKDITGIVVGDTGYLSKPLREELGREGITFITGLRRTTKQLVTLLYDKLRRLRQMIETVNGQIKYRRGCVSSLPRSENGYFWRYISAILSYTIIKTFF